MGLNGRVPHRIDAAGKTGLLELLDEALAAGWSLRRACAVLELSERRAQRWAARREHGTLADARPGGSPLHAILDEEAQAILALYEQWGEVDRSHRKLAHRGSYLGRVWVSPSTVRRVLHVADLHFRPRPRPAKGHRRPFPDWATYTPNSIWIYDSTHFTRSKMVVLIIEDLVSRKWITEIVSAEETSTQVELAFTAALESEGLMDAIDARADRVADPLDPVDPVPGNDSSVDEPDESTVAQRPVLLVVSDNGPQMRSGSTREFMAMCAIAQHFGRPGTPTDQAWIETLNGHIKGEYPHLLAIQDPATLRAELAVVREHYNTVRLHAAIGYVTPDDEHEGRGEAIRAARKAGLERARLNRLASRRAAREDHTKQGPSNVV